MEEIASSSSGLPSSKAAAVAQILHESLQEQRRRSSEVPKLTHLPSFFETDRRIAKDPSKRTSILQDSGVVSHSPPIPKETSVEPPPNSPLKLDGSVLLSADEAGSSVVVLEFSAASQGEQGDGRELKFRLSGSADLKRLAKGQLSPSAKVPPKSEPGGKESPKKSRSESKQARSPKTAKSPRRTHEEAKRTERQPTADSIRKATSPERKESRKLERVGSPKKLERVESPKKLERVESPKKLERVGSPKKLERVGSPKKLERVGSPKKLERAGSSKKLERVGSPKGGKSPAKSDGLKKGGSPKSVPTVQKSEESPKKSGTLKEVGSTHSAESTKAAESIKAADSPRLEPLPKKERSPKKSETVKRGGSSKSVESPKKGAVLERVGSPKRIESRVKGVGSPPKKEGEKKEGEKKKGRVPKSVSRGAESKAEVRERSLVRRGPEKKVRTAPDRKKAEEAKKEPQKAPPVLGRQKGDEKLTKERRPVEKPQRKTETPALPVEQKQAKTEPKREVKKEVKKEPKSPPKTTPSETLIGKAFSSLRKTFSETFGAAQKPIKKVAGPPKKEGKKQKAEPSSKAAAKAEEVPEREKEEEEELEEAVKQVVEQKSEEELDHPNAEASDATPFSPPPTPDEAPAPPSEKKESPKKPLQKKRSLNEYIKKQDERQRQGRELPPPSPAKIPSRRTSSALPKKPARAKAPQVKAKVRRPTESAKPLKVSLKDESETATPPAPVSPAGSSKKSLEVRTKRSNSERSIVMPVPASPPKAKKETVSPTRQATASERSATAPAMPRGTEGDGRSTGRASVISGRRSVAGMLSSPRRGAERRIGSKFNQPLPLTRSRTGRVGGEKAPRATIDGALFRPKESFVGMSEQLRRALTTAQMIQLKQSSTKILPPPPKKAPTEEQQPPIPPTSDIVSQTTTPPHVLREILPLAPPPSQRPSRADPEGALRTDQDKSYKEQEVQEVRRQKSEENCVTKSVLQCFEIFSRSCSAPCGDRKSTAEPSVLLAGICPIQLRAGRSPFTEIRAHTSPTFQKGRSAYPLKVAQSLGSVLTQTDIDLLEKEQEGLAELRKYQKNTKWKRAKKFPKFY